MGIEEQKEEREVLESIFPEEITDISETEYRIAIKLEVTNDDEDDSDPPTIILNVQYPEAYPDEAPRLDVSSPPNAPKHPYLDVQEDKSRLLDALNETIEENLGMAMVFTIYSALKDLAELLITERQTAKAAILEIEAQKAEEEENRKFHGTAVTRESFLKWREGFKREMEELEARKLEEKEAEDRKKKVKEEKKLTGKELWVQGIAKGVDEEEDSSLGVEKLKVEA